MDQILSYYFEHPEYIGIKPINEGLINDTFQLNLGVNQYILQKINTKVFKNPEVIISNTLAIGNYLKTQNYSKSILEILPNKNGNYITFSEGETWRMIKYIPNSVCINQVSSKEQAFNAAKCISEFHRLLIDFPMSRIQPSIPGFLDFKKRVEDFKKALETGNPVRKALATNEINFIQDHLHKIKDYLAIPFPERIVHGDAKIGNFLFDEKNPTAVLALIDWDTILPGNILCDFGDMVRTYANLKAEDDPTPTDHFSFEYYESVKDGFLFHLKDVLLQEELDAMDLTAFVVILIQAIRFLTDFLNDDVYYHTTTENQNWHRTINQINLLKALQHELWIN